MQFNHEKAKIIQLEQNQMKDKQYRLIESTVESEANYLGVILSKINHRNRLS